MEEQGLRALVVTGPEEISYLSGLANQGHFVFTALVVDAAGEPATLVAREMEEPTAAAQASTCAFAGYGDSTDPAELVREVLPGLGRGERRVGYQPGSLSFPVAVWRGLDERLRPVSWVDCDQLLAELQAVRSEREINRLRQAGRLSDIGMRAGVAAASIESPGGQVVGAIEHAMLAAGSDYPGFVPLVRSTEQIRQEHVAWVPGHLSAGDTIFLELSGACARYHVPLGRTVRPRGSRPERADEISRIGLASIQRAMRPGRAAGDVYREWSEAVGAELGHAYTRHHCGYVVGLGFPPSWMAGRVASLRPDNSTALRAGMTFHIQSWILDPEAGVYALSDTALLTRDGCELLTQTPHDLVRPAGR